MWTCESCEEIYCDNCDTPCQCSVCGVQVCYLCVSTNDDTSEVYCNDCVPEEE